MLEIPRVLRVLSTTNATLHLMQCFFVKRKKKKKKKYFLAYDKNKCILNKNYPRLSILLHLLKLSKIIHFVPFDTTPTGCCQIQQDIILRHVYSK